MHIVIRFQKKTKIGVRVIRLQDNWVEQCYNLDKQYKNWKVL